MAEGETKGVRASLEVSARGQILNRICEAIDVLDLEGIGDNIWIRKVPMIGDGAGFTIPLPGIILSPMNTMRHNPRDAGAAGADYYYLTSCSIIAGTAGRMDESNLGTMGVWEEQILDRFSKRGAPFGEDDATQNELANNRFAIATTVEPGDMNQIAWWKAFALDAFWLTIVTWVRKP